jgi:O-antigen ligase
MALGLSARVPAPADALALALFLAPPLAVYAPAATAPLAALAAVAIVAFDAFDRRWPALGAPAALGVLLAVAAWGAATALWSIRPDESLKRALQLAGIFLAGSVLVGAAGRLDAPQRRNVAAAAALGIALALALVFAERITGDALRRLVEPAHASSDSAMKRASTLLVLLMAGPAAWLWRDGHRWAAVVLALAVGGATLALESIAARLAWIAFAVAVAGAWYLPRVTAALIAAAIAAVVLLTPAAIRLLPNPAPGDAASRAGLPASAAHRLMIWHYAAGKVAERPWLGWGLDSARSLPDARKVVPWDMGADLPPARRFSTVVVMPLHPHHAPLQWRMELGVPGVALGTAAALLALAAACGRGLVRSDRAAAVGLVAAGMTVAVISYGAWQSWWLSTLFLAAAGMAAAARSP